MNSREPTEERRQTYRVPVPLGACQRATLRRGHRAIPVCVLDESVGGFAVACGATSGILIGEEFVLETERGRSRVQLLHIEPIHKNYAALIKVIGVRSTGLFRLGFKCLSEIERSEATETAQYRNAQRPKFLNLLPNGATTVSIALMVLIPIAAGIVFVALGLDQGRITQWTSAAVVQPVKTILHTSPGKSKSNASSAANGFESAAANETSGDSIVDRIRRAVAAVPGPDALLLPDVAERLDLSSLQQLQIEHLVQLTRSSLAQLARSPGDQQTLAETHDEIIAAARRKAEALLDGKQRAELRQLLSGDDDSSGR